MNPIIAVHGGAGTILPEQLTPELEKNYREGLVAALQYRAAGWPTTSPTRATLTLPRRARRWGRVWGSG